MADKIIVGQNWQVAEEGGYLANPRLSKQIRRVALPEYKFRQFARVEKAFGKNKGDKIIWNRVSRVLTPGRAISEDETVPETKIKISRGELVVTEYANSIPWTGKLEALAEWDPENLALQALKDDQVATIDAEVAKAFKKAKVKYVPTGTADAPTGEFITDDNLSTATRNVSLFDVKKIRDYMYGTLHVPPYDGENYICLGSVSFCRAIKDDLEEVAKYAAPDRIFSGEIGRYEKIRFIEVPENLSNVLGSTNFAGEALIFGEDPVIEGVAIPEEVRAKLATDFGRDKGIAWYAILGWEIVWETANPGEARIVHITSA
jgi:N4-gp56 family major capsid protein